MINSWAIFVQICVDDKWFFSSVKCQSKLNEINQSCIEYLQKRASRCKNQCSGSWISPYLYIVQFFLICLKIVCWLALIDWDEGNNMFCATDSRTTSRVFSCLMVVPWHEWCTWMFVLFTGEWRLSPSGAHTSDTYSVMRHMKSGTFTYTIL